MKTKTPPITPPRKPDKKIASQLQLHLPILINRLLSQQLEVLKLLLDVHFEVDGFVNDFLGLAVQLFTLVDERLGELVVSICVVSIEGY